MPRARRKTRSQVAESGSSVRPLTQASETRI
jgi:hypothetical protein